MVGNAYSKRKTQEDLFVNIGPTSHKIIDAKKKLHCLLKPSESLNIPVSYGKDRLKNTRM